MLSVIKEEVLLLQFKRRNQQSFQFSISLGRTGQTLTSFPFAGFRHEIFFSGFVFYEIWFQHSRIRAVRNFFRARIEGHHYINQ